jgi:predicted nucleic acid-binding protein
VILVDTSVWVAHIRFGDAHLTDLLEAGAVYGHPFVVGEIACGNLKRRAETLYFMKKLPAAPTATDDEALSFLERRTLFGRGIGYVDVHLLASAALAGDARLWSLDRRLVEAAAGLGLEYSGAGA